TNQQYRGVLVGDINERNDTGNHINWGTSNQPSGGGDAGGGAWYNCAWGYRRKITIDHNQVPNTDQNNFPVLFNQSLGEFKYTGNGGHVGLSTGTDILFTDASGAKLSHELETYNPSSGQVVAWVKVPTLSHTTDTTLFMYYGNANAADQQNKTSVWDSNYKGVLHLPNGTTLTANDSTANANNGTLVNSPTATTGQIDGGAQFDGAGNYIVNSSLTGAPSIQGPLTMSIWMKYAP